MSSHYEATDEFPFPRPVLRQVISAHKASTPSSDSWNWALRDSNAYARAVVYDLPTELLTAPRPIRRAAGLAY